LIYNEIKTSYRDTRLKPPVYYLTDKKIPLKERDSLALLACKNDVLAIFGVAISDKVKVDDNTKNIIQLIKK